MLYKVLHPLDGSPMNLKMTETLLSNQSGHQTIHSSMQTEHFGIQVDYYSIVFGGSQTPHTYDDYQFSKWTAISCYLTFHRS